MEPVVILLGTLRLSGVKVAYDPAPPFVAKARAGQAVRLVVDYDYVEPTEDEDNTHIRLSARRGGETLGEASEHIDDRRVLDDSRRSFVMLEAFPHETGRHLGSYQIKIKYLRSAWKTGETLESHDFAHSGSFELEIS